MKNTEIENLKSDVLYLISYMVTSARGCVNEPKLYGPYRLLDTTVRLINLLKKYGVSGEDLDNIKKIIESGKDYVMTDVDAFVKTIDHAIDELVKYT